MKAPSPTDLVAFFDVLARDYAVFGADAPEGGRVEVGVVPGLPSCGVLLAAPAVILVAVRAEDVLPGGQPAGGGLYVLRRGHLTPGEAAWLPWSALRDTDALARQVEAWEERGWPRAARGMRGQPLCGACGAPLGPGLEGPGEEGAWRCEDCQESGENAGASDSLATP